jgi:hypothetical protein
MQRKIKSKKVKSYNTLLVYPVETWTKEQLKTTFRTLFSYLQHLKGLTTIAAACPMPQKQYKRYADQTADACKRVTDAVMFLCVCLGIEQKDVMDL